MLRTWPREWDTRMKVVPPSLISLIFSAHLAGVCRVARAQHLVGEQDVRRTSTGDSERQAGAHARGVVLERDVDELAQLGERDYLVVAFVYLFFAQTHVRAREVDVVAARFLRVEARAEREQRGNAR